MSRVASGPAASAAGSDGVMLETTKVITTSPPSINPSSASLAATRRSTQACTA